MINSWCPKCRGKMVVCLDKFGDHFLHCRECNNKYIRFGYQGPLCVKEI